MPLASVNANNFTPIHAMLKISLLTCLLLSALITPGCTTFGFNSSYGYGKRTLGTLLNDQAIESSATSLLNSAQEELSEAHINITAFNGIVLITGQVASDAARLAATDIITGLRHVRIVHNKLAVAGPTSMISRSNDVYLTTKVKSVLFLDKDIVGGRTKVVTENGTVFLLGLLTQDEADAIIKKTSEISGVQKIVGVFEYIN